MLILKSNKTDIPNKVANLQYIPIQSLLGEVVLVQSCYTHSDLNIINRVLKVSIELVCKVFFAIVLMNAVA